MPKSIPLIVVPSRGRAEGKHATVAGLAPLAARDAVTIHYVVPREEVAGYRAALRARGWPWVTIVPCPIVTGLPAKVQWIADYYLRRRQPRILRFDDDVVVLSRRPESRPAGASVRATPRASEAEVLDAVTWMWDTLQTYAHTGLAMRLHADKYPLGPAECKRMTRVMGWRLDVLKSVGARFDRTLTTVEDFSMTLQLLRAGYPNLVSYTYVQEQEVGTNAPGGCAVTRTLESHNADMHRLAEQHAGFVRLREHRGVTGGTLSVRVESHIYWQRAFAHSAGRRTVPALPNA